MLFFFFFSFSPALEWRELRKEQDCLAFKTNNRKMFPFNEELTKKENVYISYRFPRINFNEDPIPRVSPTWLNMIGMKQFLAFREFTVKKEKVCRLLYLRTKQSPSFRRSFQSSAREKDVKCVYLSNLSNLSNLPPNLTNLSNYATCHICQTCQTCHIYVMFVKYVNIVRFCSITSNLWLVLAFFNYLIARIMPIASCLRNLNNFKWF